MTTSEDLAAFEELVREAESKLLPPTTTQQTTAQKNRWTVATLAEVAEFFGASVQTVKQWRQEHPPMPGQKGQYSIKEIVAWRTELRKGRASSSASSIDAEIKAVTLEEKRLDLAIRKKELLDRSDVERWAAVALIETREAVMTLPEMLATSSPPEIREFVRSETDRHCREVLSMLHRRLDNTEEIDGEHNVENDEE